ncbi:hypothetical protein [Streptococcus suis]|uniref:hypothetical protein n=1 Tax=Streptococcus suis TaxID=1307 RepID=UPI001ABEDA0C|nr:hypothetical protein [Streptococcus suis]
MAGIVDKLKFIRNVVENRDTSENAVTLLTDLKTDKELLPVYKVPISVLAVAALDVLGIEKYQGFDDDVQLWKVNLLNT